MTLLPATAGFLPLHLFWTPAFERAASIAHAINAFALETMGLAKADESQLRDLSLRDLLDAVATVEQWNEMPSQDGVSRSIYMVPAERLTAAVYTLIHFRLRPQDETDDLIVRMTERRWGDDVVHFLAVGRRDASDIEADNDEKEAA